MNRRDFLTVLIRELKNIDPSELQDVLQYYNEYFDEAGKENEQSVIAELGSPEKIAAEIKKNSAIKYVESEHQDAKKSFKSIWVIIGAIFAAPIALPFALAFGILAIALVIVLASLLFSFFMVSFALAVSGILVALTSFFIIPVSFPSFLLMFGAGLILAGLSILVFIPTLMLARVSFKWLGMIISKKILRRNNNNA